MASHLSDVTLRALLEGRSNSIQEGAHLLACARCQHKFISLGESAALILEKLRDLQPVAEQLESPGNVHMLSTAEEHYVSAQELATRLADLTPAEREQAIAQAQLPEIFVAAGILASLQKLIHDRPSVVAALCELGRDLLAPDEGDWEVNHRCTPLLLAELNANLANALRVQGRSWEADPYMDEALVYADQTPDQFTRGEVYKFASLLATDHRRFDECLQLARKSKSFFESIGRHGKAREIDLIIGWNSYFDGRFKEAAKEAEGLFQANGSLVDEHVRLAAGTLLVRAKTMTKQYLDAFAVLKELGPLARMFPSERLTASLKWFKGLLLARSLGPARGNGLLEEARNWFLQQDLVYEAALVTLDSSMIRFEHGHYERAAILAGSIVEAFTATGRNHHALLAVKCFCQAVENRAQDLRVHYVNLHRYLPLAKRDPDYAYQPETP